MSKVLAQRKVNSDSKERWTWKEREKRKERKERKEGKEG